MFHLERKVSVVINSAKYLCISVLNAYLLFFSVATPYTSLSTNQDYYLPINTSSLIM